ncbi:MAG: alanine racemase [Acidobacteriota bacterium]
MTPTTLPTNPRVPEKSETQPAEAAKQPDTRGLNAWIEVSAEAYRHNLEFIRQRIGSSVELGAVVKANAYGHGLEQASRLALESGADSLCVHALDEALALRRAGHRCDVLIMGHVPLARLSEAVRENFRLVLFSIETAERLAHLAQDTGLRPRVHVKIETGTHRQGLEGEELSRLLDVLAAHPSLEVEGAYTHFADIEDTTDHAYARRQLRLFEEALETLRARGFEPSCRHAACSAASLLFPETHFDMVRVGISQYGFWSSKETRLTYQHEHAGGVSGAGHLDAAAAGPRPSLSFKARISQVKNIPAGASVGYGRTWQATRPTRLAVLPIGYADGYDRLLSNRAHVLVGGRRAPVRGRVCMNLTLIDVTDVPEARLEDEVVLIGRQGDREVRAEELAELAGTIPYEVVARLAPHLPRLIV